MSTLPASEVAERAGKQKEFITLECRNLCLERFVEPGDLEPAAFVVDREKGDCYCVSASPGTVIYNKGQEDYDPNDVIVRRELEVPTNNNKHILARGYVRNNECDVADTSGTLAGYNLNVIIPDKTGVCFDEEGQGNLIMVFKGISDNRDINGYIARNEYERKRNCAFACMNKWDPHPDGTVKQWEDLGKQLDDGATRVESMRQPTGFSVNPVTGTCYCLLSDYDTCFRSGEEYRSWRIYNTCGALCKA